MSEWQRMQWNSGRHHSHTRIYNTHTEYKEMEIEQSIITTDISFCHSEKFLHIEQSISMWNWHAAHLVSLSRAYHTNTQTVFRFSILLLLILSLSSYAIDCKMSITGSLVGYENNNELCNKKNRSLLNVTGSSKQCVSLNSSISNSVITTASSCVR